jgi:hypothetical protein
MTWRRENSWPYRDLNSEPSVAQPIARRCTDCAIQAPIVSPYRPITKSTILTFFDPLDRSELAEFFFKLRIFYSQYGMTIDNIINTSAKGYIYFNEEMLP